MCSLRTMCWKIFSGLVATSIFRIAAAGELLVNGGFESHGGAGSHVFSGWTFYAQPGATGGFMPQSGTKAPLTPFDVPLPPIGNVAAMSDQSSPGGYLLYQDVAVPVGETVVLTARLFVLNQADRFSVPATLDYTTVPNQQVRFDVMDPASALLDVGAGVLSSVFSTQATDDRMRGYFTVSTNLTQFAGRTIRLRFAETDNQQGLIFGVDEVSVATVTVPGAPTIDRLTAGNGILRVFFSAPSATGGSEITGYSVTCMGTGATTYTATGATSPIVVSGLANGIVYTCRLHASNIAGAGPESTSANKAPGRIALTPWLSVLLD